MEDVSPSIKFPRTRERRPPGYAAGKTSLFSTSIVSFPFFSPLSLSSPTTFLLCYYYRKKTAVSLKKEPYRFDRLPNPSPAPKRFAKDETIKRTYVLYDRYTRQRLILVFPARNRTKKFFQVNFKFLRITSEPYEELLR